jgi:hypothetical protein
METSRSAHAGRCLSTVSPGRLSANVLAMLVSWGLASLRPLAFQRETKCEGRLCTAFRAISQVTRGRLQWWK